MFRGTIERKLKPKSSNKLKMASKAPVSKTMILYFQITTDY